VAPRFDRLYAEFARRLREQRIASGLSQEATARRAGLSRTSITNIEQGHQHVSLDVVFRLAGAIGVEPVSLLPPSSALVGDDGLNVEDLEGLSTWDQQFVRIAVEKHGGGTRGS
jgi:transcriptional regulator with XRE-family HTH domain